MIEYKGWRIDFDVREDKIVVLMAQEIGSTTTIEAGLKMAKSEIDKIMED